MSRPENDRRMDPSEAYLKLLKGEITSEEYVKAIRSDLEHRRAAGDDAPSAELARGLARHADRALGLDRLRALGRDADERA